MTTPARGFSREHVIAVARIAAGLLFMQHGLEKLFGFAGARPEPTLWAVRGVGGILETLGGRSSPLVSSRARPRSS